MRIGILFTTLLIVSATGIAASFGEVDPTRLGEALGYYLWQDYQHLETCQLSPDDMIRGIQKASRGEEITLDRTELHDFCIELYRDYTAQVQQSNLEKSEAILRSLAERTETRVLADGKLVVEILSPGTGKEIDSVGLFHLQAKFGETLILDTQTGARPVKQELRQAIEGFDRGVGGMREGERRRLYIHPDLGYGVTDTYHPNELLVLEVELLECLEDDVGEMR